MVSCWSSVGPFFCFQMITRVNINEFSQNFEPALILRRSCLSYVCPSVFAFPDDSLVNINDFHQIWYVHWYCRDLVWDC